MITFCFFCLFATQDEERDRNAKLETMCPRFPEPVPLQHPIPSLKEALEKVRDVSQSIFLTAIKGEDIYNMTTLILHSNAAGVDRWRLKRNSKTITRCTADHPWTSSHARGCTCAISYRAFLLVWFACWHFKPQNHKLKSKIPDLMFDLFDSCWQLELAARPHARIGQSSSFCLQPWSLGGYTRF